MVDYNSFFNPEIHVDDENVSTEFRPSYKNGKAGVFTALVRFLPDPTDPAGKSIRKKNVAYLENPLTQQGKSIDCPSSVGKPDPILDTFFALRNSGNAIKVENSKKFSRRQKYASIIQVLSCPDDEKLVNGIFAWSFGKKVYDKLVEEMNPSFGTPKNPFDIINGRPFMVRVIEQSGFNNFDQSKFVDLPDEAGMMKIEYKDRWVPVSSKLISNDQGKELVFKYLTDNAPDMSIHEYHDWDEETSAFVANCIKYYTNGGNPTSFQQASNIMNNVGAATNQPNGNIKTQATKQNLSIDDILSESVNNSHNTTSTTAPAPTSDLQLDVNASDLQNPGAGTGFSASSLNVPGLDDILGSDKSEQPKQNNKGSEDTGLGLDDILGDTFV